MTFEIGQRIETADDVGRVLDIDGGMITVGWQSGVKTTQSAEVLAAAVADDVE